MGYEVKDISELDSLDFSTLEGTKEQVRKSIDGTKFIIQGDNITSLTHAEAVTLMRTSEWNDDIG